MNIGGRQLEEEVAAAYAGEQEVACASQAQALLVEQNSNMGQTVNITQTDVRRRICKSFNPDTTYKSNWKRFKLFVDEHRDNQSGLVDDGLFYITCSNVKHFFLQLLYQHRFLELDMQNSLHLLFKSM